MAPFTPLFDEITKEYGLITSAVYGYVWRMCQKERGACDASFQTIANDLNMSRKTVINHVKTLVKNELITDLTPDANRKPHRYLVKEIPQTRETDTLPEKEARVLDSPARVLDSLALGQEIPQTRVLDSPKDTIQEDTRINIIKEHFQQKTGLLPNQYGYSKDWLPVLEKWLETYGDQTESILDKAIDIAQGSNETGKRYRITSPRSLNNIIANCAPERNLNGRSAKGKTLEDNIGKILNDADGPFIITKEGVKRIDNGHNKQPTN